MIRLLQQDNRIMKIIFAVIIGLAAITMVITLVPGIFDNSGGANDATVYATVKEPGFFGRTIGEGTPIKAGVTVSDNAVREDYKVDGTKVKFDYVVISADDVRKGINPSDADLQAFFKNNAARYATAIPETRKIQYVSFDASNLPGGKPQVSDADVQAYYNAHKDQYQVKEQVKTHHILIAAAAD